MKSIDKEGVFHRKHEQRDYKVAKGLAQTYIFIKGYCV